MLHCHRKAVTTATRARNRLKSFLSDHHVRLNMGIRLTEPSGAAKVKASAFWTPLQKLLLEEMLGELQLVGRVLQSLRWHIRAVWVITVLLEEGYPKPPPNPAAKD